MLIGTMPEIEGIKRSCSSIESFKRYSKSLIPDRFRNIPELENNQLYICASVLLNTDVHYDVKGKIAEECMSNIYVNGCMQNIIELNVLLKIVSIEKLDRYIEEMRIGRVQSEHSLYT